ncbi:MAG: T9SS type A sorting domain-containing protein [candidate division WOR-3 bacterium]|nr:T9SS type A sorting domain-containing protein [candidate division WOR-3 bacterium]MDH5683808.1 T9SS type A sorting domain-containing protein [candidate division WOR-3 bacterium]
MRKFIIFSILIAVSLAFSRTLLVPEEFTTIQQAFVMAQNGDTISVNFGRVNRQRVTVSSQRIMSKAITFEVRGEGKEKLFDILKGINVQLNTNNGNWLDSGWTEQAMVNRLDTTSDQQPHLAVDNLNHPWVIWIDGYYYDFAYTKWTGVDWDEEMGLIPSTPDDARFRPRITFDDQNRAWVVYDRAFLPSNDTNITYFIRWNGSGWEPEAPVHQIDSIRQNFAPRIAFGGGEIWCAWYGDISATRHNYDIYVSRWNGDSWTPKTKISPPVGSNEYIHWFCDIAVDRFGHPHVVWGETWFTGRIYYRTHNGSQWLPPEIVNNPDPDTIRCAGWPAPAIAIDNEDNIHVVWIGFRPDGIPGRRQEVYYSKFDRSNNRWLNPVQINESDDYNDWYPDIVVAENPCDIWVVWHKETISLRAQIYASHFDGNTWSDEIQLSNLSISYSNVCPELAWNGCDVWVVWDAFTVGIDNLDIYYSRYLSLSVTEEHPKRILIPNFTIFPNPFATNISFSYTNTLTERTSLVIYNLNGDLIQTLANSYQKEGYSKITWDGKDINGKETPKGVYFVLLKTEKSKIAKKIIRKGG